MTLYDKLKNADDRDRFPVKTPDGGTFTIEVRRWRDTAVRGYGVIPDGKTKVVDGHKLLDPNRLLGWVENLRE